MQKYDFFFNTIKMILTKRGINISFFITYQAIKHLVYKKTTDFKAQIEAPQTFDNTEELYTVIVYSV